MKDNPKSMNAVINLFFVLPMWGLVDEIEKAVGGEVELWGDGKEE